MTVQRAAALSQLVEADDQLVTPPSVLKIVTGVLGSEESSPLL